MSSVVLSRVAFAYADANPIFCELDLSFASGFTGLVGQNGAGKSTLLELIAGSLTPDHGAVRVHPAHALVVACPQVVEHCDVSIREFASALGRAHQRWRARLRLDPVNLSRWATLSAGERKRWQIGSALSRDPDVLLLDEPTNHLDAEARRLLLDVLAEFRSVGIIVSHDRAFLERICDRTAWLDAGHVRTYEGSYAVAHATRESERAAAQAAHARARGDENRISRAVDQKRRQREAAAKEVGARSRMKGKRDSDGRSVNRKGRAAKAEAAHARAQRSLASRRDRAAARTEHTRPDKHLGGKIELTQARPPSQRLASLVVPQLCAGSKRVLGPVQLTVEHHSRVRIAGPNGAGKSTLLSALAQRLPKATTLHLPQELDRHSRVEALDRVRRLPRDERGRVLAVAGRLGLDPKRALASPLPSPGEAKKLAIAVALATGASCVLLDEPTNHLDLPSIARLEDALFEYQGALLLVTHDEWFGERLTSETWTIRGGQLV